MTYTGVYPEPARRGGRSRRNGDGKRVEKSSGTLYWYGLNSAPLEETNLTGGWPRDYVFFDGARISVYTPTSTVLGFFDDHLGSTSKLEEVSSSGTVSQGFDSDYYPFGRAHQFVDSYDPAFKFMGKERDAETGLDNFGARYNDSTIGRFISAAKRAPRSPARGAWEIGRAVPEAVPYANLTNPQTLNLYAMVSDNPETFADLDGHDGPPSCGQALPGSLQNCTPAAPSPAATTGEGQKTGTGTGKSSTQNAQNLSVETDKNGVTTVTLRSTDANVTTNKDGSITMTTTATTQTYKFNSAGNLISGQSQTVGTAFTMKGDQYTTQAINSSRTLTSAEATRTLGGTDFSHMDTRGTLARFPGTVAADAKAHPFQYLFKVGEVGGLFFPVAQEYEGFKLSLELHVAAIELVKALEDR